MQHRWYPKVREVRGKGGVTRTNVDEQFCIHCDCKRVIAENEKKKQWRHYIDEKGKRQWKAPECKREGEPKATTLYRYYDIAYTDGPKICCEEFEVVKPTPRGYWFEHKEFRALFPERKWTSSNAMRRYAYPTKKEAMINYIARKFAQIRIYKGRLAMAAQALVKAQAIAGIPEDKRYKGEPFHKWKTLIKIN